MDREYTIGSRRVKAPHLIFIAIFTVSCLYLLSPFHIFSTKPSMTIKVPKWAEAPLTPAPLKAASLPASSDKLLKKESNRIATKGETFSVTNSPLLCPAGKNYLFTIKPYFWETKPGQWGEFICGVS
jgi:hypothetical protein